MHLVFGVVVFGTDDESMHAKFEAMMGVSMVLPLYNLVCWSETLEGCCGPHGVEARAKSWVA